VGARRLGGVPVIQTPRPQPAAADPNACRHGGDRPRTERTGQPGPSTASTGPRNRSPVNRRRPGGGSPHDRGNAGTTLTGLGRANGRARAGHTSWVPDSSLWLARRQGANKQASNQSKTPSDRQPAWSWSATHASRSPSDGLAGQAGHLETVLAPVGRRGQSEDRIVDQERARPPVRPADPGRRGQGAPNASRHGRRRLAGVAQNQSTSGTTSSAVPEETPPGRESTLAWGGSPSPSRRTRNNATQPPVTWPRLYLQPRHSMTPVRSY